MNNILVIYHIKPANTTTVVSAQGKEFPEVQTLAKCAQYLLQLSLFIGNIKISDIRYNTSVLCRFILRLYCTTEANVAVLLHYI